MGGRLVLSVLLSLVCNVHGSSEPRRLRYLYHGASEGIVPFNNNCTALVGIGSDPADPLGEDQTFLACQTSSGAIYKFRGVCKEWIHAYIKKGILTSNQTQIDMFEATLDTATDEIIMPQFPPNFKPNLAPSFPTRSTGNKTILAIRVVVDDIEPTVTAEMIHDSLFNNPINLKSQFSACSVGKLTLLPAEPRTALVGGFVPGADRLLKEGPSSPKGGNGHLRALQVEPPALTYLSKYLIVGTGSSETGARVSIKSSDLGANIRVLSVKGIDENTNLDLRLPFVNNTFQMWMPFDNRINSRPDFLPGASRLYEAVSWTGDVALTSPSSEIETANTELYGHEGVVVAAEELPVSHEESRFYPFGIGDGVTHEFLGSRDLYRALKIGSSEMSLLRQELRSIEQWVVSLTPEKTIRSGQDGLTGDGISNIDVLEMDVDLWDTNRDGFAVIDIDLNGNDFVVSNTNWILESTKKTFAVFRLLGDTDMVVNQATIMSGDGILHNALKSDPLYSSNTFPRMNHYKLTAMFVKAQNYRSATGATIPGASLSSSAEVFSFTNSVMNGVGFYDLIAFGQNPPYDGGRTSISVDNAQGMSQFVAPSVSVKGGRMDKASPTEQFGKDCWEDTGCKDHGVGDEVSRLLYSDFSECPSESLRCSAVGADSYEFALADDLPQANHSSIVITCEVLGLEDRRRLQLQESIQVRATAEFVNHWFQFESLSEDYFIATTSLGIGSGHSIEISYKNDGRFVTSLGAAVKTGVIMTPSFYGQYVKVDRVDMCVVPRDMVCAKPFVEPVSNAGGANIVVPNEISDGVVTINVPNDLAEGENFITNQVINQLCDQFGVSSPGEVADFIVLCLPSGAMQREAYGYVNNWLSVYSDSGCTSLPLQMREIGHNLGLATSRVWNPKKLYSDSTDWDTSGAMGGNDFASQAQKCFGPSELFQLGWMDPQVRTFRKDSLPESYVLESPIRGEKPNQVKIIHLDRKSPFDSYIMYNWKKGANIDTDAAINSVIVVGQGAHGVKYSESYLQAQLRPGERVSMADYFDGKCNATIEVLSCNAALGFCDVSVTGCTEEDMPTTSPTQKPTGPTPSPTVFPTAEPTASCIPLDGVCATEEDCCDGGQGACIEEKHNDGFNVKIVCKVSEAGFIDPLAYPGTCDDNGVCEYGENCFSCPHDCNSLLAGPSEDRYCCDGYLLERPPDKAGPDTQAPTAAPTENCRLVTMDFGALERGSWIYDQFQESSGIRFSAMGKANSYCWTPNPDDLSTRAATFGAVRVFDTWIPTGGSLCNPSEGDLDLGSPNQFCEDYDIPLPPPNGRSWRKPGYGIGGAPRLGPDGQYSDTGAVNPYANCVPQGKALVIQDSNKTCPDECEYGGLFKIQFPYTYGANVTSVTLLNLNRQTRIQIWAEHGGKVRDDFLENSGRNSVLVVPINTDFVRSILFSFYGTGAIGSIDYRWCQEFTASGATAMKDDHERRMYKVNKFSIKPNDPRCEC